MAPEGLLHRQADFAEGSLGPGRIDRQLQHLRNILSVELDIERLRIESATVAHFALHKCRREEIHLQLDRSRPFALRTASLRARRSINELYRLPHVLEPELLWLSPASEGESQDSSTS